MPSTYSDSLQIELQAAGENAGTWGTIANNGYQLAEEGITGVATITVSGDTTLTITQGTASSGNLDQARNKVLLLTGTPGTTFDFTLPEITKTWKIYNNTDGSATLKTASTTTAYTLMAGCIVELLSQGDGTVMPLSAPVSSDGTFPMLMVAGAATITGVASISGLSYPAADGTAGQTLVTDGSGGLSFATPSGSGDLLASANLSDLDDAATARDNLGIVSQTKATLEKTFVTSEQVSITLDPTLAFLSPNVSVTKSVAQTGVTGKLDSDPTSPPAGTTAGTNYDRRDYAPSATLTPSSATADGTFTLGTGSFSASDVGLTVEGNGGSAVITNDSGAYVLVTAFDDATAIASGDWSLYGTVFDAARGWVLSGVGGYLENTAYDTVSINTDTLSAGAIAGENRGVAFNGDGTKLFGVADSGGGDIYELALSTAYDISTASYTARVTPNGRDPRGIKFNGDGTKLFTYSSSDNVFEEYALSTAYDLTTLSFTTSFNPAISNIEDFDFNADGTKCYFLTTQTDAVSQFSFGTAYDVTTLSTDTVTLSVASETINPRCMFWADAGGVLIVGDNGDDYYQYELTTAYDLSTGTYSTITYATTSIANPVHADYFESEELFLEMKAASIYQSTMKTRTTPTSVYFPQVTNASGQIDTQFWDDINSITADESAGSGAVYYAVSTDGRTIWNVVDDSNGVRPIARNNASTWEYNSNATYASTTWTSAAPNTELRAIQQALGANAANRMDKTQLDAVTDANQITLGDTFDLMISNYSTVTSSAADFPSSDAVTYDYDAQALNKGAILGTDYDYDMPASDTVRLTANSALTLKVRIT